MVVVTATYLTCTRQALSEGEPLVACLDSSAAVCSLNLVLLFRDDLLS